MSSLYRSFVFVACLLLAVPLFGQERKYTIGTTFNLIGGRTNYPLGTNGGSDQATKPLYFYGAYPTLNLTSAGAHSVISGAYSLGMNRDETVSSGTLTSHSLLMTYSATLSKNFKIAASDSAQRTDDSGTFGAFRATTPAPEDLHFVFNPVAAGLTTTSNNATFGVEYTIDDKSSLSFSGSHRVLSYSNAQTLSSTLSNQQGMSGNMTYNRKTGANETWSVKYGVSYFDFASFQNSLTQSGQVGYSTRFGRDIDMHLSVGASQTQEVVSHLNYVGYTTSASLGKTLQNNQFSLFYNQISGDSSGLGSISNTRQVGFSLSRAQKNVAIVLNVSAFDTSGILDNTLNARGVQGAATLGIPLTRTWSVRAGGQIQEYDHTSAIGLSQKRVFLSLYYSNPDLFRFFR
jgi:hypothetical protein